MIQADDIKTIFAKHDFTDIRVQITPAGHLEYWCERIHAPRAEDDVSAWRNILAGLGSLRERGQAADSVAHAAKCEIERHCRTAARRWGMAARDVDALFPDAAASVGASGRWLTLRIGPPGSPVEPASWEILALAWCEV